MVAHLVFPQKVDLPSMGAWGALPDAFTDLKEKLEASLHESIPTAVSMFVDALPEPSVAKEKALMKSLDEGEIHEIALRIIDGVPSERVFNNWVQNRPGFAYYSGPYSQSFTFGDASAAAYAFAVNTATRQIEATLPRVRFVQRQSSAETLPRAYAVAPPVPLVAHEDLTPYVIAEPAPAEAESATNPDPLDARLADALALAARDPGNLELVDSVTATLREASPNDPWTHAGVRIAEDLQIRDPARRAAAAEGLLRIARALEFPGPREVAWSALTTWQSLIPITELTAVQEFLLPGTHADTVQVALRCIWNCASLESELPALPALADRCLELVDKYFDPDVLALPRTRALVVDALLAACVLAPETEVAARVERARKRGRAFAWRILRSSIEQMHEHALSLSRPTPRLSVLESMTRSPIS
jgi:hypothetical protein